MNDASFSRLMATLAARVQRRWLWRGALHAATAAGLFSALGVLLPLLARSVSRALGATAPSWTVLPILPEVSWTKLLLVDAIGLATAGLVGASWAWRRRPSPAQVALLFDFKLGSRQEISAAHERSSDDEHWNEALCERAASLLREAVPSQLLPRAWRPAHWLLPVSVLTCNWAIRQSGLDAAPGAREPGTQVLALDRLDELTPLTELAETTRTSDSEAQRLRDISANAERLQRQLSSGMTQREALADVAKLQDSVRHELEQLTSRYERTALDAAIRVFQSNPDTLSVARALDDGDLERLDQEMRRLSAAEERAARLAASKTLGEATAAARAAGGVSLVRNLTEQQEAFERRALASERLDPLVDELGARDERAPPEAAPTHARPPEARNASESAAPAPPLSSAERPGETAEHTRAGVERGQADFRPEQGAQTHQVTGDPGGDVRQDTTDALPHLSEPSPNALRYQTLMNASRALARLQSTLSGHPLPLPKPRGGPPGQPSPQDGRRGQASGGENRDEGDHSGSSQPVSGLELHAKTDQPFDPRRGRTSMSMGRSAAQAIANDGRVTPQSVRAAAPQQLEGVFRASIPAEYRQQVSRYFSSE